MTDLDQLAKPVRQIIAERDDARLWAAHLGAQQLDGASVAAPPGAPIVAACEEPADHEPMPEWFRQAMLDPEVLAVDTTMARQIHCEAHEAFERDSHDCLAVLLEVRGEPTEVSR